METGQRTMVKPEAGRRRRARDRGRAPHGLVRLFLGVAIRHPGLAAEGVRFALAVSAPGWARTTPFLPVAEPTYRDWRLITAYGTAEHLPSAGEIKDFLRWRRRIRRHR